MRKSICTWATGLQKEPRSDEDEFVELVELTMEECFERIETGAICDAKTIFAVYFLEKPGGSRR